MAAINLSSAANLEALKTENLSCYILLKTRFAYYLLFMSPV